MLLARYLCQEVEYPASSIGIVVNGARRWSKKRWVPARALDPGAQSHAWIELDGLIVDISGDQFVDQHEPVFVTKDRTWHDSFGGGQLWPYDDIMRMNDQFRFDFEAYYAIVLSHVLAP